MFIKCFTTFTISADAWADPAARDWLIHLACRKLDIFITNQGSKPWGVRAVQWVPPESQPKWYPQDSIHGIVSRRSVSVVPVHPEEWDTCIY